MAITVRLQGDWSAFDRQLTRLVGFNFVALHVEIGEHMLSVIQQRFDTETDPRGNKWEPSARVREEGGQTLTDAGLLRRSFTRRATAKYVAVGTPDKRARIHNFGGTIRPRRRRALRFGGRFVSRVTMPQREFMGVNDENLEEMRQIIQERIEERLQR